MKTLIPSLALAVISIFTSNAQQIIDLYPGVIPNSKESNISETGSDQPAGIIRGVTKPTLEIYLPENQKGNRSAVIICPGGGYSVVVYQSEGIKTAREFARNGVAAFVLKYRLPLDSIMEDKNYGPLQDALQSIKVVRENANKWGIDSNRIGIMGFSAGGHLASTAATHYQKPVIKNSENTNLRPDFQILIYPVISMQDGLTHLDSRMKLLGDHPSKELIDEYSNELQIDDNTPPAYITHAGDDKVVDVDNSIEYYEALKHNKVPAELHVYPKGNHGFVLRQPAEEWMMPLFKWMKKVK